MTQLVNIVEAMKEDKVRKQLNFKAGNLKLALKMNNTKQYINITDGVTNKSIYGKIDLRGNPLYKNHTPLEVKEALLKLNQDSKLNNKVTARETAACQICGKELSDPDSMKLGIGPECLENSDFADSFNDDEESEE